MTKKQFIKYDEVTGKEGNANPFDGKNFDKLKLFYALVDEDSNEGDFLWNTKI